MPAQIVEQITDVNCRNAGNANIVQVSKEEAKERLTRADWSLIENMQQDRAKLVKTAGVKARTHRLALNNDQRVESAQNVHARNEKAAQNKTLTTAFESVSTAVQSIAKPAKGSKNGSAHDVLNTERP